MDRDSPDYKPKRIFPPFAVVNGGYHAMNLPLPRTLWYFWRILIAGRYLSMVGAEKMPGRGLSAILKHG